MNLLIRKSKVLYHFTAARFVEDIKRQGLTMGSLPWHRCKRTGEPLVIRSWHERTMTAAGVRDMRSKERQLRATALQGNPIGVTQWPKLFPGFQWLTTNSDFAQPFAMLGELPIAKNAFRITVLLPEERVVSWRSICERAKPPSMEEINTPAVDWENWWIHEGHIHPSRFLEVARNSGEHVAAAFLGGRG